jgi:hypothetical protein
MVNNIGARVCGITLFITVFLGLSVVSVWLGVASLVPQEPFVRRDIPTGVCLIVFALFIGIFGGIIGGGIGLLLGLLCDWFVSILQEPSW